MARFTVSFKSPLQLCVLDAEKRSFQLATDFVVSINARPLTVPAGFQTDLASVPRIFQNVIENDDSDISKPSVLHDFLYSRHGVAWQDKQPFTRAECDDILRDGMDARMAYGPRMWCVWAAVRAFGWIPWNASLKASDAHCPMHAFASSLYGASAEAPRSDRWRTVRADHLVKEGWCRSCSGTQHLQVHHIAPFHLHPEDELVDANLITLCEDPKKNCHLWKGHFGNWSKFNPNVRKQCTAPQLRPRA